MALEVSNQKSEPTTFADAFFNYDFMNVGIIFMSSAGLDAAREMHRTFKPGGFAVVNYWRAITWMLLVMLVHKAFPGETAPFPARPATWTDGKLLRKVLVEVEFQDGNIRLEDHELPLIQTAPVADGPPEFVKLKDSIVNDFVQKVPEEYYIPQQFVDNPPKDVTGIARQSGIMTEEELDITEKYDASSLADAIRIRKLTAVAVVTAFAKRAIIAHQVSCCLVDWFMDEAVQRAKELDEYQASTDGTVGPLHGIPISLKEHIPLAGHYSAAGYVDTRVKDTEDCHMVAILRKLGAIFYCKTHQPQSLMHLETDSPYGRVLNPYNINLSAGGSTGGEAALIALRGSVLGIGTDIGGSIRGPSGFCGIYGFKPTSRMLPMHDFLHEGAAAELNILISAGPMSTTLKAMDFFMFALLHERPYLADPQLVPVPWKRLRIELEKKTPTKAEKTTPTKVEKNTPIKVGIMMHDGHIQPQPPVTRALEWAKAQLQLSPCFQVKPFMPYRTADAIKRIRKAYWPDGGKGTRQHLEATGEPMFPLTKHIIKDAEGPELTASEVHQQRLARDRFRFYFASHWTEQDVDVVICPVFVGPACAHDTAFYWNYTAFWNYVDYPAAVFPTPITALKKGDEDYAPSNKAPLSKECEHVRKMWAEGDFEGAPIALQIVARRYHDNQLFGALKDMQEALQLGD
ncbi:amidase signature enzyme [Parathielavia appendiculata]|uniref:Amidase signature enzyme n=1 Tax=Parathielavia appendiculata TaxID=2587402 RepID=A0AAN6Z5A3_9PEZI|nr:amidase signature enzyme [Parathielavia appendiculata]